MSSWECTNRAYGNYLKGSGFWSLWNVYFRNARYQINKLESKRFGFLSRVTDATIDGAQRYHNWKTFHVGMGQAIRHFGEENIKALAEMVERARDTDIKFLDLVPREKHVSIRFEIRKDRFGLGAYTTESKEWVAIEGMENGRITKLGNPLKYERRDPILTKEWLLEHEKAPEEVKKYKETMDLLNGLITQGNKK